jgi:GNAT superfamily N-acetyltransferase
MSDLPIIRRATPADLESLVRLRLALFGELHGAHWEPPLELVEETHLYLEANLPQGAFLAWVAEADGAIVSTSGLVLFERPPTPDNPTGVDAYVMNTFTVPKWRGRGLAGALLRELIAYVRTTAARRIWLYATEAGRPVYAAAGFASDPSAMELLIEPEP